MGTKPHEIVKQSPELTEFYQAYKAWLDAGAPEDHPSFVQDTGLCGNLRNYAQDAGYYGHQFVIELKQQFIDVDLPFNYPFHKNLSAYFVEVDQYTTHLNPDRNKWVEDHCKG